MADAPHRTIKIDRHHCITLIINGVTRRFLIDTGANHTVIDPTWAVRRDRQIRCEGIGGEVIAHVCLAEFRLFGKALNKYVVADVSLSDDCPMGKVDGIIGRDFLMLFKSVSFDYAAGVVRFIP